MHFTRFVPLAALLSLHIISVLAAPVAEAEPIDTSSELARRVGTDAWKGTSTDPSILNIDCTGVEAVCEAQCAAILCFKSPSLLWVPPPCMICISTEYHDILPEKGICSSWSRASSWTIHIRHPTGNEKMGESTTALWFKPCQNDWQSAICSFRRCGWSSEDPEPQYLRRNPRRVDMIWWRKLSNFCIAHMTESVTTWHPRNPTVSI